MLRYTLAIFERKTPAAVISSPGARRNLVRRSRMPEYTQHFLDRYWSKVNKSGPAPRHLPNLGSCWLWIGAAHPRGYGHIKWQGKMRVSHRISYELAFGAFDESLWVLHRCDNPRCVNPDHLRLGNHQDNMDDMVSKGRHSHGERHTRSKLTDAQIIDIRTRYAGKRGQLTELANEFNVSVTQIYRIVHGVQR
jgi:HNH endonuclease/helix-turn-helix resolvase-like protein